MSTPRTARIMGRNVDVSKATPDVVRFLASYFEAKSGDDVDALMAHFLPESVTYVDATVGWAFRDWQTLYDKFAELLEAWPAEAVAYPTRIVGDFDSAVVFFTDSPEMFGHELRAAGTVDFRDGRIVRWVDTWDGRSLTVEATEGMRVPEDVYPGEFAEAEVGENASPSCGRPPARSPPHWRRATRSRRRPCSTRTSSSRTRPCTPCSRGGSRPTPSSTTT